MHFILNPKESHVKYKQDVDAKKLINFFFIKTSYLMTYADFYKTYTQNIVVYITNPRLALFSHVIQL